MLKSIEYFLTDFGMRTSRVSYCIFYLFLYYNYFKIITLFLKGVFIVNYWTYLWVIIGGFVAIFGLSFYCILIFYQLNKVTKIYMDFNLLIMCHVVKKNSKIKNIQISSIPSTRYSILLPASPPLIFCLS